MTNTPLWKTGRVRSPLWLSAILLPMPLIAIVLLPSELADPQGSPGLLLVVFAFMAACMWPLAFAAHWIEGHADRIRIRFWPVLSRTVPFERIAWIECRSAVSAWEFGGIGLRMAPRGVLAFANRTGPGIGIRTIDGREYFVILTDDTELSDVLERIAAARPDLHVEHTPSQYS
ncbi:hypothetical protein PTQ19_10885 [Microbacterium esteraromaticum]|uniref:hypothetical protein n=1 Tax=Microbacterium esteraromaticum TaxID=57043 RepID=UPI002368F056|nr:hypothetical protein [Microbacterium esteraromaticum]WDH78026.1 hypothetical protein PTQ19_10885 [Microbacterium esteraromaticum]